MSDRVERGSKARRLGRGLSSLMAVPAPVRVGAGESHNANDNSFSSIEPKPDPGRGEKPGADAASGPSDGGVRDIPVGSVVPNKYQPRRAMDETALAQLADSIRRSGLMQPIIVRPIPVGSARSARTGVLDPSLRGPSDSASLDMRARREARDVPASASAGTATYELVAGERRWRAAMLAGLTHVPAIVRDLSDEDSAEWAIVENVQREDLNPIERAWAFRSLVETFGLTHGQVAERIGIERPTVANFIRLTELEEAIQGMISSQRLTLGHGKVLLGCPPGAARTGLAERAIAESWNIRRLEREVGAVAGTPIEPAAALAAPRPIRSAALDDLEKRLGLYLGTKVHLSTDRAGSRGRLTVEFYGLDHFDGMMSKIGFSHG